MQLVGINADPEPVSRSGARIHENLFSHVSFDGFEMGALVTLEKRDGKRSAWNDRILSKTKAYHLADQRLATYIIFPMLSRDGLDQGRAAWKPLDAGSVNWGVVGLERRWEQTHPCVAKG